MPSHQIRTLGASWTGDHPVRDLTAMISVATSISAAAVPIAPGVSLVEQEARALLVRLGRVKPFALQQTMVPAAALPPASLSAIDRYLIEGRQKVHRMVRKFIHWLRSRSEEHTSELH